MTFSALKFLLTYTVVLFFFEIRRSPGRGRVVFRTFMVLAILMVAMFGYLLRYLRMVEHMEEAKIFISQAYPAKGSLECEFPEEHKRELYQLYDRTVAQEQDRPARWWSLQFPSTTVFRWSWKQLTERHPGPTYDR